jgi:hypothetical protein
VQIPPLKQTLTQILHPTLDLNTLKAYVYCVDAKGGSDDSADVLSGLQQAATLD